MLLSRPLAEHRARQIVAAPITDPLSEGELVEIGGTADIAGQGLVVNVDVGGGHEIARGA